jgi:hypothetical protein
LKEGQGKGANFGIRGRMNIGDGLSWYSARISRIRVVKDARGRSMIEEAMMGKWDDESLAIFRVNVMWRIKSRNLVWFGSFCSRKLCRFEIFSFIWSACGHCNSCSEGLHTLRSIRQGGPSHWHCTDTRIVSRWRFSFRQLGTNADPNPYYNLLFFGLLAVSDWLLAALLPD